MEEKEDEYDVVGLAAEGGESDGAGNDARAQCTVGRVASKASRGKGPMRGLKKKGKLTTQSLEGQPLQVHPRAAISTDVKRGLGLGKSVQGKRAKAVHASNEHQLQPSSTSSCILNNDDDEEEIRVEAEEDNDPEAQSAQFERLNPLEPDAPHVEDEWSQDSGSLVATSTSPPFWQDLLGISKATLMRQFKPPLKIW